MPHSDLATHPYMIDYISSMKKKRLKILDCGVGSGLIGQSLATIDDKNITIDGIEIFEPYIKDDDMKRKIKADHSAYREIEIGSYNAILPKIKSRAYDVIIFGDSLEHVHADWAEHSLSHALRISPHVIVNFPIITIPQTAVHGNQMELHRLNWNGTQLEYWGAIELGGNDSGRCYVFNKNKMTFGPKPLTKEEQDHQGFSTFMDTGKRNA